MNEEEFKKIVMSNHRLMAGIASAILNDSDDVRDCMQDSLVSLWTQRGRLKEVDNPEGYCVRTVRNIALTMLRRQRRLDDVIPEIAERLDPEFMMVQKDRLSKVMESIESLPGTQREVVRLTALEGLPPDDIAKREGLSPENVRTILSRARKRLRNLFKER